MVTQCVVSLHECHVIINCLVINSKSFHVNCMHMIHIGLSAIYVDLPLLVYVAPSVLIPHNMGSNSSLLGIHSKLSAGIIV